MKPPTLPIELGYMRLERAITDQLLLTYGRGEDRKVFRIFSTLEDARQVLIDMFHYTKGDLIRWTYGKGNVMPDNVDCAVPIEYSHLDTRFLCTVYPDGYVCGVVTDYRADAPEWIRWLYGEPQEITETK